MLSAAIILPGTAQVFPFDSLRTVKGVEWEGIYYSGTERNHSPGRSAFFSSPELLPMICDLLIVMDPKFCNFDYLSFAIRNGCHLFLSDKLQLTAHERRQLVMLANEGGTYIQIQNDFLFHPFQEKIRCPINNKCFIEASQSAPASPGMMNELLRNNLLMILRTAGSPVHKINVFCGTVPMQQPDLINTHMSFKNGSAATLTLKLTSRQAMHYLSVHSHGELTTFDFTRNVTEQFPEKENNKIFPENSMDLLQKQITDFIKNIAKKQVPVFTLDDETQVYLLMEKILEKIKIQTTEVIGEPELKWLENEKNIKMRK